MSSNIATVTNAARETDVAANQVLEAAGELSRNGVQLKTQVDGFLARVRA
ncbi:hypothetical protein GCM10011505_44350 [Tistrella bauzanensis]|uniref:Methyl-accepting chemotaxis protein n=1 Tax=Tistrella bauzanensis TaxID=657419 RepID=A0ABQ1J4Q1_9PROT|nr:hypothetical protein [Tistrella bauzanensis]GGB58659.1 hypothetical protein GCM10011505_44350 [Tistrella bauzanensis]